MATFTDAPWDGTQGRWKSASVYVQDCLIDLAAPGAPKRYEDGKLPYREPDGKVNLNAMSAAAAALAGARGGVDAPPLAKRAAAKKLLALYDEANMTPPDSLRRLAL